MLLDDGTMDLNGLRNGPAGIRYSPPGKKGPIHKIKEKIHINDSQRRVSVERRRCDVKIFIKWGGE